MLGGVGVLWKVRILRVGLLACRDLTWLAEPLAAGLNKALRALDFPPQAFSDPKLARHGDSFQVHVNDPPAECLSFARRWLRIEDDGVGSGGIAGWSRKRLISQNRGRFGDMTWKKAKREKSQKAYNRYLGPDVLPVRTPTKQDAEAWRMRKVNGYLYKQIAWIQKRSTAAVRRSIDIVESYIRFGDGRTVFVMPDSIKSERTRLNALLMRIRGKSYIEIAKELELANTEQAKQMIKQAIEQLPEPVKEEIRRVDLERLDQLYDLAWQRAQEGDVKAMHACLAIIEKRWKLFGLGDKEERAGEKSVGSLLAKLATMSDDQLLELAHKQRTVIESLNQQSKEEAAKQLEQILNGEDGVN